MCLYKTHRFPKIAKNDIQVKKKVTIGDEYLYTYVFGYPIKNNIIVPDKFLWKLGIFNDIIEEGWIHSADLSCNSDNNKEIYQYSTAKKLF